MRGTDRGKRKRHLLCACTLLEFGQDFVDLADVLISELLELEAKERGDQNIESRTRNIRHSRTSDCGFLIPLLARERVSCRHPSSHWLDAACGDALGHPQRGAVQWCRGRVVPRLSACFVLTGKR